MSAEAMAALLATGDLYAAGQALPVDYSEGYVLTGAGGAGTIIWARSGCSVIETFVTECDWAASGQEGPCPIGDADHHAKLTIKAFRDADTAQDFIARAVTFTANEFQQGADLAALIGAPVPTMAPL